MRHRRGRTIAGAAGLAAAVAALAAAQTPDRPPTIPSFGVSTELVYVRFHVEKKGGYVEGLTREQAYELVQRNAMQTWEAKHAGAADANVLKQLQSDPEVAKHFAKGIAASEAGST